MPKQKQYKELRLQMRLSKADAEAAAALARAWKTTKSEAVRRAVTLAAAMEVNKNDKNHT